VEALERRGGRVEEKVRRCCARWMLCWARERGEWREGGWEGWVVEGEVMRAERRDGEERRWWRSRRLVGVIVSGRLSREGWVWGLGLGAWKQDREMWREDVRG